MGKSPRRYAKRNQQITRSNEIFSNSDQNETKKHQNSYKTKSDQNNHTVHYKTPGFHKFVNVFIVAISLFLIIFGGMSIYAHDLMSSMFEKNNSVSINFNALPSVASEDVKMQNAQITDHLIKDPMILNIALFGSDVRPGEGDAGNSDTILLVSIDNRHQKIKLTSFMRDTWVSIPKVNYNGKLNAAYAAGGPVLAVETIERNFGIDIDRYAVVDFETFPVIIDTLGGIDVTINDEEAAYLHHDWPYRTPSFSQGAGTYHLNGQEALDHARNRHVGFYDFERTQRQRDVLLAIVDKFKDTKDISVFVNLMVQFLPSVSTNISVNEMSSLAQNALKYIKYPITQFRLPTNDNYSDQENSTWGSILVIDDIEKAREDLARFIYEETADRIYGQTGSKLPDISIQSDASSYSSYSNSSSYVSYY
ncbi:MAG: LCP family protein [Clostridia bacterium]|nr:LCP family protein [Clostridia bacterium]